MCRPGAAAVGCGQASPPPPPATDVVGASVSGNGIPPPSPPLTKLYVPGSSTFDGPTPGFDSPPTVAKLVPSGRCPPSPPEPAPGPGVPPSPPSGSVEACRTPLAPDRSMRQIGRASCRERAWGGGGAGTC